MVLRLLTLYGSSVTGVYQPPGETDERIRCFLQRQTDRDQGRIVLSGSMSRCRALQAAQVQKAPCACAIG